MSYPALGVVRDALAHALFFAVLIAMTIGTIVVVGNPFLDLFTSQALALGAKNLPYILRMTVFMIGIAIYFVINATPVLVVGALVLRESE